MLSCHHWPVPGVALSGSFFKATVTPWFIPYESWCVAALGPYTMVTRAELESQMSSGPHGHS